MLVCYPHCFTLVYGSAYTLNEQNVRWKCGHYCGLCMVNGACHGHCVKVRVLFLVFKGGNGVWKSMLLQCQKRGGSVHSWEVKGWDRNLPGRVWKDWPPVLSTDIWRTANEDHGLWLDAQTEGQKVQGLSPCYKNTFTFLKGCSWYFQ